MLNISVGQGLIIVDMSLERTGNFQQVENKSNTELKYKNGLETNLCSNRQIRILSLG